ncbi:MAG: transposase zinc-binding domain-containing protein [Nitrospirae bacterium]|nr:transposase zinc-binding domain-containing protein [Nitrospirota bacterium]
MQRPRGVKVEDIFRRHGPEYRHTHPLPLQHLRVMRAVEACRTAELGGHKGQCADCGHIEISYNSCRNRHCPKCQTLRKEKWIEDRGQDLLPIEYYHTVFTVPSELNHLFLMNPRVMFNLLFRSASETLVELVLYCCIYIRYTKGEDISSKICYTPDYTNSKGRAMEYENVRKILKNKSRMITMRINPELLKLLDEAIRKDKQFDNRNEFIEACILKYLEAKGKL